MHDVNAKTVDADGPQSTMAAVFKAATKQAARRRRRKSATTGRDSVLALVEQKGSATTKEIKARWEAEGRRGSADNVVGLLVKAKELKPTPPEDLRDSR
jgi:hypothetical protein